MRFAALILGLFAGLGHIAIGQSLKGAIFGSLFIICLNGLLLGQAILIGTVATTVFWSSVGCAIAVWGIAYRDLVLSLASRSNSRNEVSKRLGRNLPDPQRRLIMGGPASKSRLKNDKS